MVKEVKTKMITKLKYRIYNLVYTLAPFWDSIAAVVAMVLGLIIY